MKRNRLLLLAWSIFFIAIVLFFIIIEMYHSSRREQASCYQYKILINSDSSVYREDSSPHIGKENEGSDDKFYEQTKYGYLPKISHEGISVFEKYSAFSEISSKKRIKVAILLGSTAIKEILDKLGSQKVTFIMPSYLCKLEEAIKQIRENGHEFFIQIPTQSSIPADKKESVSPFLANADMNYTIDKLLYLLGSAKYAIGIANMTSTLFTKSGRDMLTIANELAKRGVAFFDLEKSNYLLKDLSRESGLKYIYAANVFSAGFNVSEFKDGDIIVVPSEHIDTFMKILPKDWTLAPVTAPVKKE